MTTPMIVPGTDRPGMAARAAHGKWIYLAAGASALAAALILLAGIAGFGESDNWLITIFRLHAGANGVLFGRLYQLNALDITLLALVAITHAGLYLALRMSHRILAPIAFVQPLLGILLFVLAHNAGRSAVMGAGLVISIAALRGGPFRKWIGWAGLLSSILLLAGDLGTDVAPNSLLAIATGVGYILLIGWLLAVGYRLQQLAR